MLFLCRLKKYCLGWYGHCNSSLNKNEGGTRMKKITKILAVVTLSAFLGVNNPAMAQNDQTGTTTTTTTDDNDDDDDGDEGKWGLLGLLGLAGLLGLKRRDNDTHRTTTNR
jgi:MYXO-CTERM domain-containing protein